MNLDLTSLYERDEEGWWVAEIPEVAGVYAQGKTKDEARAMVYDALQLMLESRRAEATNRTLRPDEDLKSEAGVHE